MSGALGYVKIIGRIFYKGGNCLTYKQNGKNMKVRISDHFNYRKLFGFVLPSVIMLVVTSVYTVIDWFFVSNFVGKTPFAAVNLIMPVIMIFGGFGFMIGTGGTAYVSMLIGKGEKDEANRCFTALNNGLISAVLSVLRTLVFQIAFVFILPAIFGVDGIWWAMLATEICATVVSVVLFIAYRKKYNYV